MCVFAPRVREAHHQVLEVGAGTSRFVAPPDPALFRGWATTVRRCALMDIYSTQPRLARKRPRIERKNDMDPMAKNGGSARMRSVSVEVNDQKLLSPKAVGELQPPADYDFTESTKDNNCATADHQSQQLRHSGPPKTTTAPQRTAKTQLRHSRHANPC